MLFRSVHHDKLPALQIAMMDDFASYETLRDDLSKWTNLPFWQIPPDAFLAKPPVGIFMELVPSGQKVVQARARVQQIIGLLQAVEAVRAYAAESGGKLPATLEATKLPVPVDSFSGKPFAYEVKGESAVIRGTAPLDRKTEPFFNRVYEVTIRK